MTWDQSKSFCERKGAILAEIKTANQMEAILKKIAAEGLTKNFWLGIVYDTEKSNWVYASNNETTVFTYWSPGEPNNLGKEICAEISYHFGNKWNNSNCKKNNWANNRVALCQQA